MAAKRRLLKEPGNKLVVFHFVHIFLPQSAFPCEPVPDPGRVVIMQRMVGHNVRRGGNCSHNLSRAMRACVHDSPLSSLLLTSGVSWKGFSGAHASSARIPPERFFIQSDVAEICLHVLREYNPVSVNDDGVEGGGLSGAWTCVPPLGCL